MKTAIEAQHGVRTLGKFNSVSIFEAANVGAVAATITDLLSVNYLVWKLRAQYGLRLQ